MKVGFNWWSKSLIKNINFPLLFLSPLWSDLSMWGHFLIVLNLRNPNLISAMSTMTHFMSFSVSPSSPPFLSLLLLLYCVLFDINWYFLDICIQTGRYDVTAGAGFMMTFHLSSRQTLFLPSFLLTFNIRQRWYHLNLRKSYNPQCFCTVCWPQNLYPHIFYSQHWSQS